MESIVYAELDASDKELSSRAQFDRLIAFVESSESRTMSHAELEEWLTREGRELQRRLLQEHFDLRAAAERPLRAVRGADGVEREAMRPLRRTLGSVFGPARVKRLGYEVAGAACLCPLDAGLNLPPTLYSYGVRRWVAQRTAKDSFDEVVVEVGALMGTPIHKRQVEELARAAAQDFEAF